MSSYLYDLPDFTPNPKHGNLVGERIQFNTCRSSLLYIKLKLTTYIKVWYCAMTKLWLYLQWNGCSIANGIPESVNSSDVLWLVEQNC